MAESKRKKTGERRTVKKQKRSTRSSNEAGSTTTGSAAAFPTGGTGAFLKQGVKAAAGVVALEGVLVAAVVAGMETGLLQSAVPGLLVIFPHIVLVVGGFMAWRFARSRVVLGLVILAMAEAAVGLTWDPDSATALFVFHSVAILVPVNFYLLTWFMERGVMTPAGLTRLGALSAQAIAVFLAAKWAPETYTAWLSVKFLPASWASWTVVGDMGIVVFLVVLVAMGVRLVRRPNATGRGLFWATVSSFVALHFLPHGAAEHTVYFSTAGLMLIVGVVEASYFMAYSDTLTQLPTRRALMDAMLRLSGRFTVAMVDVDHFKRFNDDYGHDVGDQVLRMVAGVLERIDGGGKAFRYGGEEFTLLFPGKGVDEAMPYLERVRAGVEAAQFVVRSPDRPKEKPEKPLPKTHPGQQLSVKVSIGAAEPQDRKSTPEEVLKAADRKLYKAKEQGRNQVVG